MTILMKENTQNKNIFICGIYIFITFNLYLLSLYYLLPENLNFYFLLILVFMFISYVSLLLD